MTCINSCGAACDQSVKIGPFQAVFPRFYFDQIAQTCKRFIYGGCGGNDNNFSTIVACYKPCLCSTNLLDSNLYIGGRKDTVSSSNSIQSFSIIADTSSLLYSTKLFLELETGFTINTASQMTVFLEGCL